MQGMGAGAGGDDCPFAFNFDASTFKVGDTVSYRVTGDPTVRYRGTRESRPEVSADQI